LGDKVAGSVKLTKSKLVVVLVVQNVEEIAQEGVEVLLVSSSSILAGYGTHVENGELRDDSTDFLVESVLGELDFSHID
jgi:hypothetical protein